MNSDIERDIPKDLHEHTAEDADAEPESGSTQQSLIAILRGFPAEDHVVSDALEALSKGDKLEAWMVKRVIVVYEWFYNNKNFENQWKALETLLKEKCGVTIKKANVDFNQASAIGYEIVNRYAIFQLEPHERAKIQAEQWSAKREGIILFEICPQVSIGGELELTGKVIVS